MCYVFLSKLQPIIVIVNILVLFCISCDNIWRVSTGCRRALPARADGAEARRGDAARGARARRQDRDYQEVAWDRSQESQHSSRGGRGQRHRWWQARHQQARGQGECPLSSSKSDLSSKFMFPYIHTSTTSKALISVLKFSNKI